MKITLIILGAFALLVLLSCMGLMPAALEVPFTLALGWATYLTDVLPTVHVNRPALGWSIIALAALLLLGHTFAQWLWRELHADSPSPGTPREGRGEGLSPSSMLNPPSSSSSSDAWRLRWTLAFTALTLLTFTAGLAATGVAHQSAWLARSDTPVFINRFGNQETHDRTMCANNLEQIGYALTYYTADHAGRYPDALAELISGEFQPHYLTCPAADPQRYSRTAREDHPADHPEYTYYARGLRGSLPARTPIASEPITHHRLAGVNILFADGKVEWHTPAELQSLLNPAPPTHP